MGAKDHQRPEYTSERLSLPFPLRLPLATSIAALSGLTLGLAHGSQERGLRFRAENAHRLPNSQVGWYLYHKSKNYHVALGGIQEGCKMALKQGFWVGAFFGMEEAVDRARFAARRRWVRLRGRGDVGDVVASRDFCSSVLAGLGTAGGFSAWSRCLEYATCGWCGADAVCRPLPSPHRCESGEAGPQIRTRIRSGPGCRELTQRQAVGLRRVREAPVYWESAR